MGKKSFTQEQIVYALRQAESGTPVLDVCRKLGVTEQPFAPLETQIHGTWGGGSTTA